MDYALAAALAVFMRWTHLILMAVLIGGMLYARFVMSPALAASEPALREHLGARAALAFRGMLAGSMLGLIGSGIFNYLTHAPFPPGYQVWFGIKMLLAAHIFAVGFLLAWRPMLQARRDRLTGGALATGAAVLLISAVLRYLTRWG